MKLKSSLVLSLPALTLLAASLQAAEPVAPPAPAEAESATAEALPENPTTWMTVITPRLFAFNYFDGMGEDKTHFLERYYYREGWSGDTRSDVFADLDLDVTMNNGERDLFVLERRGFGEHNHHGLVKYSNDALNVYGNYSHYRSATGGIDYLYRPSELALLDYGGVTGGTGGGGGGGGGGGFANTFNDDSGTSLYSIDRTTYGAGFKIKPAALGNMATISVDYAGYQRDGNKFAPFLLDSLGAQGGGTGQQRWRGINLAVDERMNRIGLTLTASPQKRFELAYEVSYEEFVNNAPELQMQRDITDPAGLNVPANTSPLASLFYVADTNLINHGIRASKNYNDRVMLAAGYGTSWLKQDSFSELELVSGHTRGRVTTDNAYLTANAIVSPDVSVEGHIKYYNHDNDSTFPDALISLTTLVAPRINSINSMDYGVAASWRPDLYSSNLTLGWNRLDKERDLTFGTSGQAIDPAQTLYREDTLSDEVYLKWSARPALGWNLRITPSYTWADKTGLVTEPEEAFKLKSMLSYAAPAGWVVNGFYDYTNKSNSNNTFSNGTTAPTAATYAQDIDSTLHSVGASLNIAPRDYVNTFVSLYWMQDDASSYLFSSTVQRWNPAVVFTLLPESNYKVDSYVFSVGGEWEFSDKLNLNGSYTYSKSKGDVASGVVLNSLVTATGTVDALIDNTLHSFALGGDYAINPKAKLRVHYIYDQYDDKAYDLLSGGVHVIAVGVAFTL